jgi:hypothetical protein
MAHASDPSFGRWRKDVPGLKQAQEKISKTQSQQNAMYVGSCLILTTWKVEAGKSWFDASPRQRQETPFKK